MYFNPGVIVEVVPLQPYGTNSTFFTECCTVAICDHEPNCPLCGRKIIGWDAESPHARNLVRWKNATKHWKRK